MGRKIVSKQLNSSECVVCGYQNEYSMNARFYNSEDNEVITVFKPDEKHQGYPGRLHGGMAAAVLDETIGRVLSLYEETMWAVTVELTIKYRKPVPVGSELKAIGRLTQNSRRIYEGCGELLLPDGSVAVEAKGKYYKIPIMELVDEDFIENRWAYFHEDDLNELDI